ncbi:hypothetical protein [Pseudomonas sp. CGJS7]|uniref:hypothetical protein n=1 Tax=Pseudomonas sp. CGJS7 TaxID=3109348 RepID=UPI003008A526
MSASASAPANAPKLDAEQVLDRLLTLIRESERVEQFTAQRLSSAFGVTFSVFEPGYWGFGEQLSPQWSYGMEMRDKTAIGSRFSFSFNAAPGATPPLEEICRIDYARFASALEAMGFKREPYYGEHGRFINDWFERPGMRIAVYPLGEADAPGEKASRVCVKEVQIP